MQSLVNSISYLPGNCKLYALLFFPLFGFDFMIRCCRDLVVGKEIISSFEQTVCFFYSRLPVAGTVIEPGPCTEVSLYDFVQSFFKYNSSIEI